MAAHFIDLSNESTYNHAIQMNSNKSEANIRISSKGGLITYKIHLHFQSNF